jgi:hypothetical protein
MPKSRKGAKAAKNAEARRQTFLALVDAGKAAGWNGAVKTLSGRGRWWVRVLRSKGTGPLAHVFVRGNVMFGNGRWVLASDMMDVSAPKGDQQ